MPDKMSDEQVNKIAQAIAAKLAEPGRPGLLGCGDASSSENYRCETYNCSSSYECGSTSGSGGAFYCVRFRCYDDFWCNRGFGCITTFDCAAKYIGPY